MELLHRVYFHYIVITLMPHSFYLMRIQRVRHMPAIDLMELLHGGDRTR